MKLRNLRIGYRLGGGFGLIMVLMLAITTVGGFQLFQNNIRIGTIVHEQIPATLLVNTIKADLADMVGNMRDILAVNEPSTSQADLALMEQDNQFIDDNIAKLEKMMVGSEETRRHIANIKEKRTMFNESRDRFAKFVKENQIDQAKALLISETRAFADNYVSAVDLLLVYQGKLSEQAGKSVETATQRAMMVMGGLAAFASLIGVAVSTLITRGITRPLNDAVIVAEHVASGDLTAAITVKSSDEIGKLMLSLKHMNESLARIVGEVRGGTESIATASVQIASGTAQLSLRTEQQADSLQETAASIGQVNSTVSQNASSAEQANRLVTASTSTAIKGGNVVSQVIETMGMIKISSRRIEDIISVVDGIAFQTNILALNAAVEAARAGNNGRGFAVVASEVRSLAQRSAEAAKEIKALINDSMQKVDAGNVLVASAGKTMNEIVASVKEIAQIMAEITAASREQSTGINTVTQAIMEMGDITQQNAALVEQATAATASMKDQAVSLSRAVSFFKLTKAAPEDAIALVQRAGAYLMENGLERTLTEINNSKGLFVDRELYIIAFSSNGDGIALANGANSEIIGKNMTDIRDVNGKYMMREVLNIARKSGSGWVDYKFPHPVTGAIEEKSTYVEKIGELLLVCGIYK